MIESVEQKYCIKFCQKLGNNQTKTIQKIQQAFGNEALSQTQIKEWFNSKMIECQWRVRQLWQAIHKLKQGGDMKVCQIVMEDCLLREIVEEVEITRGLVHSILTKDLCMQKESAKFILKLLTKQQELHVEIAQDMLDCTNNDLEFTDYLN